MNSTMEKEKPLEAIITVIEINHGTNKTFQQEK